MRKLLLLAAILWALSSTTAGAVSYENAALPLEQGVGLDEVPTQSLCGPTWNGWQPVGCHETPSAPLPDVPLVRSICGPEVNGVNHIGCIYF